MAFRGSNHEQRPHPSKNTPPDDTHQEAVYLKMLGEKQQPVQIKLRNGDVVHGWIEYYDRRMVRLTREVPLTYSSSSTISPISPRKAYANCVHRQQPARRTAALRVPPSDGVPARGGSDCARGRGAAD